MLSLVSLLSPCALAVVVSAVVSGVLAMLGKPLLLAMLGKLLVGMVGLVLKGVASDHLLGLVLKGVASDHLFSPRPVALVGPFHSGT